MTALIEAVAVVVGAYFLGSIPVGLLVARARGIDIREVGSGNIGATNVARGLGKKIGAGVLVLDALKGALPVLAVRWLGLAHTVNPLIVSAAGFAAVAGHCFPIWLGFHGGKGVATSLGVYLALDPLVTAAGVGVFAVIYAATRIVSIGSLIAAVAFPVLLLLLGRSDADVTLGIAVALVIIYRHKANISRLLHHREYRV